MWAEPHSENTSHANITISFILIQNDHEAEKRTTSHLHYTWRDATHAEVELKLDSTVQLNSF